LLLLCLFSFVILQTQNLLLPSSTSKVFPRSMSAPGGLSRHKVGLSQQWTHHGVYSDVTTKEQVWIVMLSLFIFGRLGLCVDVDQWPVKNIDGNNRHFLIVYASKVKL
jgi:hypothetical protein